MNELILIPCSCKKEYNSDSEANSLNYKKFNESLDVDYEKKLKALRNKVAESFNINLENDKKVPAFKVYKGKLYSQLDDNIWKEVQNREEKEVCIMNPLYGIIHSFEPIIIHDLTMEDNIGKNRLNTWWKHNNLSEIFINYIEKNDFDLIRSLLPVSHKKSMPFIQYNLNIEWLQYDYPQLRSGSNYYRGWDLSKIIRENDIICPECETKKTKRISKEYFGCIECGTIYSVEK